MCKLFAPLTGLRACSGSENSVVNGFGRFLLCKCPTTFFFLFEKLPTNRQLSKSAGGNFTQLRAPFIAFAF